MNFSLRTTVGSNNQSAIAGFTTGGGRRIMLLRAVGPTLALSFGLEGVLTRPRLELFDSSGRSIAVAVPWLENSNDVQNELQLSADAAGAFRLVYGFDAVLLVALEPGSYSCVVSGDNGTTGIVLIEGYEVPSLASGN